jgi:hypothetical protein
MTNKSDLWAKLLRSTGKYIQKSKQWISRNISYGRSKDGADYPVKTARRELSTETSLRAYKKRAKNRKLGQSFGANRQVRKSRRGFFKAATFESNLRTQLTNATYERNLRTKKIAKAGSVDRSQLRQRCTWLFWPQSFSYPRPAVWRHPRTMSTLS